MKRKRLPLNTVPLDVPKFEGERLFRITVSGLVNEEGETDFEELRIRANSPEEAQGRGVATASINGWIECQVDEVSEVLWVREW